jgi:hypothetical protein
MRAISALSGFVFHYWTVIGESGRRSANRNRYVLCRCECGTEREVFLPNLKNGKSKSCGCRPGKRVVPLNFKHGMSETPEYQAWNSMIHRCTKKNDPGWKHYGDRGIRVCDAWLDRDHGFALFFDHVGQRPSDEHSLDRIDVDGHYEPGNVRWATREEQSRNRRKHGTLLSFTTDELMQELRKRGVQT